MTAVPLKTSGEESLKNAAAADPGYFTATDVSAIDPEHAIGEPGKYPFTRGIHPSMYRGRLWTMRQFAGFGTARHTNERFRFLIAQGQSGLSTAFDLPTLMGLDSDDPRACGEVGRLGVAMDTIEDMRTLFQDIPLDRISVSMTINAPAAILMAFYLAAARERAFKWNSLRGTIQNDPLKEFHAQNEITFPLRPSIRLAVDVIEFAAREVPQWNPVSISGYHIREAGATAGQELAFTLADGRHYVEETLRRGLVVDDFASRLSFFFNVHNDFFEEIAESAYCEQRQFDRGERVIIGVNRYQTQYDPAPDTLEFDPRVEPDQIDTLQRVKRDRSPADVARALKAVRQSAEVGGNLMPALIDAAHARATKGEILKELKSVFGDYHWHEQ